MRGPDDGDLTLWELVAWRAALDNDKVYLVDDLGRSMTFGELRDSAERVAAALHARGIGPGTAVTWQLPTWQETVVLTVALARLGAVQNPVIPIYGRREVEALVRQAGSRLLVVPAQWRGVDYAEMGRALAADLAGEQHLEVLVVAPGTLPEADPAGLPPAPTDPYEVRWLYATSGTTSLPKSVKHTDNSLIWGGRGVWGAYGLTADDVGCMPFPFAHIGGPDYLTMTLQAGCKVVLIASFVAAEAVKLHHEHGITASGGSTAFYLAFLAEQRKQPDVPLFPTVRFMSGGGAPMPSEIYWEVKAELGIPCVQGYGMTECPMIASNAPGDSDDQLAHSEGKPVPGLEFSIRNESGDDVEVGVVGEVWVRGPMLFVGYTDEQATKDVFDDLGYFRTGDLGWLRPDGHLRLTGRLKDMIIRKGENISPQEVEEVVQTHPAIAAVAVVGLPDRDRGELVCAVVELAPGHRPPTLAELMAHCQSAGMSRRKVPERIEVMEAMPRTATMKVLKRELRELLAP